MSDRPFPWRTLLLVSVALNLLMIGGVVGAFGAGVRVQREEPPEAIVERIPGIRAFVATLPPEARPELRRELGESWRQTRELRRSALEARRAAFDAAAADPYDVEHVRAAFATMRAADQAVVGAFHDSMAQAFAGMTAEQRRDMLERLRRAPPATRRSIAPALEDGGEAMAPGEGARQVDREALRERLRERRRERRERMQQTTP